MSSTRLLPMQSNNKNEKRKNFNTKIPTDKKRKKQPRKKMKCKIKEVEGDCPAKKGKFYCTRKKGHKGKHHAHGLFGRCILTRENKKKKK